MRPGAGLPRAVLVLILTGAALASSCSGTSGEEAGPATTVGNGVPDSPSATARPAPEDSEEPISGDEDAIDGADPAATTQAGDRDGAAADDREATGGDAVDPGEEAGVGPSVDPVDPSAEPVDSTAPDPGPGPAVTGPIAPLTGLVHTGPSLDQRRAVAVKVGHGDKRSRPQTGLAAADVVYEVLIEGTRTRLLAVFHSDVPDRIGPVRSVRSGDLDLITDLSMPYLVSSGANDTVLQEMRRAQRSGTMISIPELRNSVVYSRDRSRRSPFNLYFHHDNLGGADGDSLPGGPPAAPVAPLFQYGSANAGGIAGAAGVTVVYHERSGNVVSHIWDAAVDGWVRIQEGELMLTENGSGLVEIAPANVAVLWMPYRTSAADVESPQLVSFGSGDALVLTAGAVHEAVWERTEDRAGYRFSDPAGNPLSLSPGSTWLLLANTSRHFPVARAAVLAASEGARLLADARDASGNS